MAASKEEIARDILIAALGTFSGRVEGKRLGEEYRELLKQVGEGIHEERQIELKRP